MISCKISLWKHKELLKVLIADNWNPTCRKPFKFHLLIILKYIPEIREKFLRKTYDEGWKTGKVKSGKEKRDL